MPDWDPNLYLKFSDQRARPAADLIAQIKLDHPEQIIDLGCGTGNSTEQLHQRWPKSQLTGLDNSDNMLAQARKNHPDWEWVQSSIESWNQGNAYDLVFSNAALHWVPDHTTIFPRLLSRVSAGGALAVQMPYNFQSPAHQGMKRVAADPRWGGKLDGASEKYFVQPIAFYYRALSTTAAVLNLWEAEYLQIMDSPRAILEWVRGTAMRGYLERLPDEAERKGFEELCLKEFERSYVTEENGKILFPYRRMFMVAYR